MIDAETGEIYAVSPPFFRTPYNYDIMAVSDETALHCTDPTLAQQQFKEETDINTIVERFGVTGQLPENVKLPQYGDYTNIPDYQTALNMVLRAQQEFMELPADLRAYFDNDPQEFLEFVEDKGNRDEAIKLGLIKPENQSILDVTGLGDTKSPSKVEPPTAIT